MAIHNEVGKIGENIASKFLQGKGHKILHRNYWKPYGEIDIVSCEKGITHFIEVKTVSYETPRTDSKSNDIKNVRDPGLAHFGRDKGEVSHGTYRPEENVHPQKLRKLARVIEAYIVSHETIGEWQFDVIAIYLDQKNKKARVKWLKDIVFES